MREGAERTPPRRGTCGCGATRDPIQMLTQLPATLHTTTLCWLCPRSRQERDARGAVHEPALSRGAKARAVEVPHVHSKAIKLTSFINVATCRKWYRWRIRRFLRCFSQRLGRVDVRLCARVTSFLQVHIVAVKGHRGVTFCSRTCSPQ